MESTFLVWDLDGHFPLMMHLVGKIPSSSLQHFFNGPGRLYQFSDRIFSQYIKNYGRLSKRKDVIGKLVQERPNDMEGLYDLHLSPEIANLTFAATDTTSIVLSYLFWELALNPDVQARLRVELTTYAKLDGKTGVPTHQSLVSLPYLNAVINEPCDSTLQFLWIWFARYPKWLHHRRLPCTRRGLWTFPLCLREA